MRIRAVLSLIDAPVTTDIGIIGPASEDTVAAAGFHSQRGAQPFSKDIGAQATVLGIAGGDGDDILIIPGILLSRDIWDREHCRVGDHAELLLHNLAASGALNDAASFLIIFIKEELAARQFEHAFGIEHVVQLGSGVFGRGDHWGFFLTVTDLGERAARPYKPLNVKHEKSASYL